MSAKPQTYRRARKLRREMSLPEVLLWQRLRGADIKFRRQHPLGVYILDFYCASARIAIEIDGAGHDAPAQVTRDHSRDAWLVSQDVVVVRVAARDVLHDVEAVADRIVRLCRERG
jgi:very-short-patch-repair endonuclease